MLSKYFRYRNTDFQTADAISASALEKELDKIVQISDVKEIHPGGTLGQFYLGLEKGKKRFIKTHLPYDMAKKNLEKEIYLMDFLYRDVLHVFGLDIQLDGISRKILLMDFLESQPQFLGINAIKDLLEKLRHTIKNFPKEKINYKENDFFEAVLNSYMVLKKAGQLNRKIISFTETTFNNYDTYLTYEKCICHGDLSNLNIAKINGEYIFLDWEDAMIGLPDYDLLYWLTFFSQRKYYCPSLFFDLKINERYGKDIMVMILLVKSYVSYINGTYKTNKLSIQDRIMEIITM